MSEQFFILTETNSAWPCGGKRDLNLNEEEIFISICMSGREILIWTKESKSRVLLPGSPLKKGQRSDIWNWPIYKTQLPVTCGKQEGMLNRDRLAKGQRGHVI